VYQTHSYTYIYISFNSKNIYLKGNCKRTKFAPACQLCPYAKNIFEPIKKLIYKKKKIQYGRCIGIFSKHFSKVLFFLSKYPYYLDRQFIKKWPSNSRPPILFEKLAKFQFFYICIYMQFAIQNFKQVYLGI